MNPHRNAVIAGDGIGKEAKPEGLRALDAAARRFGIAPSAPAPARGIRAWHWRWPWPAQTAAE